MTLRVLLIDDEADQFKTQIEESLQSIGEDFHLDLCRDNRSPQVEEALKQTYDLIVLDWKFPDGPPGEETLKLIREKGFKGFVIIHSATLSNFGQYVEQRLANAYVWRGLGRPGLTDTLRGCIQAIQARQSSAIEVLRTFELPWYENRDALNRHAYHALSRQSSPASTKAQSRQFVSLMTCAWDEEKQEIKKDSSMGKVIEAIERLSEIPISVLILGPTGTGKELVARLLHYRDKGPAGPGEKDLFVAKNCGAFPEATLNVELVGSLPGAFTDAVEKAGLFEQVTGYRDGTDGELIAEKGGTVFLDEVALLKETTQEHLLRILDDSHVLRMGSDISKALPPKEFITVNGQKFKRRLYGKIPVKFRLITATNEDLKHKTQGPDFRKDLFYRLNRARIDIPTLASRREDFNLLFQSFLQRFNQEYQRDVKLENNGSVLTGTGKNLVFWLHTNSTWEGNVRQLENLVSVIVAYSNKGAANYLSQKDIPEFMMREMFPDHNG